VDAVEKEHAIMARLDRIDGLRKRDAPAEVLLDEVRLLLAEAEDWVREDGGAPPRAADALARARDTLALREGACAGSILAR
jgi:hypothetical protein